MQTSESGQMNVKIGYHNFPINGSTFEKKTLKKLLQNLRIF